ncbi:MAG: sulfatase/phosphatase domain-containing protein, partial [Planctomycetota bacterium]
GMPFPRAKATLYDAGTRVPLAIRWPNGIANSGRVVDHFVNLSDLAATFLDVAGVPRPETVTARSLSAILVDQPVRDRDASFTAMERNEYCRSDGGGYPCRAIRTERYLYVHNFEPDRWPAGSPDPANSHKRIPYGEVSLSVTRQFLFNHRSHQEFPDIAPLADLAFGKRPAEELYDVLEDPNQMINLAGRIELLEIQTLLRRRLFDHLGQTGDPRIVGGEVAWDDYQFHDPGQQ